MLRLEEIIVDENRLFIEENVPAEYLSDQYVKETKPVYAVALPKTHDEVVALVKYAKQEDLIIIARGSGTGVAGGQVPIHGNELIIDLKLMKRILDLD